MSESEMDNRGSKSSIHTSIGVKEQRVDGSCLSSIDKLRGTLLAHENGYQTGSLSNLTCRKYSTLPCNNNITEPINSWFVSGFTDAEGCFRIPFRKSKTIKTG